MTQQQQKPEHEKSIDMVKIAAGAFAAMASAVLLSTLGAAGTVAGAALGSVIVTVASSAFAKGVDVSKQGVSAAQSIAMRRVARARSQVGRASAEMDDSASARQRLAAANAELDAAESDLQASADAPAQAWGEQEDREDRKDKEDEAGWRGRLATLSWKRVAMVAAGLFVAAMVVITGFELVSGRAVSSLTGGSSDSPRTSFSGLTDGGGRSTPTPTPSPTGPTSESPGESPSESLGESPSESASESPDDPASESPEVEPTDSATTSTPTPSDEPEVTDTTVPQDPASPSP
jgi:hypothetical protein